jgi:hypothetical protein
VPTAPDLGVGEAPRAPQVSASLNFRFVAVVDIEDFSRRSVAEQVKMHDSLEFALSEAAVSAGLDRERWYRQPRGDGELAVLPADTDSLALVADYPRSLAVVLGEINRHSGPASRLRVRMAIHHGAVYPGRFGPVGAAPIMAARLVDAQITRQALRRRADRDIVLIVSAAVFNEVVRSGLRELDPRMFYRTATRTKGTRCVGYLLAPDRAFLAPGAEVYTVLENRNGATVRNSSQVKPDDLSAQGRGVA